jgi:hypothetical protein
MEEGCGAEGVVAFRSGEHARAASLFEPNPLYLKPYPSKETSTCSVGFQRTR